MPENKFGDPAKCSPPGSAKKRICKIKPPKRGGGGGYSYDPYIEKKKPVEEEKTSISISETVAGEGTTKYYEGKNTPEARKTPTKYSFTKGNKKIK